MRTTAVFIVTLFCLQAGMGFVSALTPETITIDGDVAEWSLDSEMASDDNAVTYYSTWDNDNFYLAWTGTDWADSSSGADFFIYFNTSEGGSVLSKDWDFADTLAFSADYGFALEDSTYNQKFAFDGTSWQDQGALSEQDIYVGWADNTVTELAIPWSAIGSPTSLQFMVYAQWQDEGNVWTSFPLANPASSNGAETFTHYYHLDNRNNATAPNTLPVIENGAIDKVDDALNLAIIFHQHQPYYKNKLTNTYEMPWVRVHAMTEYVDSPGILAQTGTKVTYNLVPSFIEQLVDYYENETLDDHTDMAKRPWPEGNYPMPPP